MGKGPTRRQGSGQKEPQSSKDAKRASREIHKDMKQGGFQSTPKGDKGYNRKEKHKTDHTVGEELTPIDETYRGGGFPVAKLNWKTSARRGSGFTEARPCGEGEDPESGHCNPGTTPPSDSGRERVGDRLRRQRAEREAEEDQRAAEYVKRRQEEEQQKDRENGTYDELQKQYNPNYNPNTAPQGGGSMQDQQAQHEQQLGRPMDVNEFMQFKNDWESGNPDQAAQKQLNDDTNRRNAMDEYANPTQEPDYQEPSGYNVGPSRYSEGRMRSNIAADLNWSTHKSETFDDDGEDGGVSSWGLKSIIDRGVQPHEKSSGADSIEDAENQTQQRDIPSKKFKSFSMVGAFDW